MFRMGPEQFGVVVLEACAKNTADVRELLWIRKLGHTMNVPGVYPTDRKWKLLLNRHMVVHCYTKAQLARITHHITDKLRCDVPVHRQLKVLTWAKKRFQGPLRYPCYQQVAYRFKQTTGLAQPNQVPLRMPAMAHTDAFPLLHVFKEFLRNLPLPLHHRDYLVHCTRLVSVRNPLVIQLLNDEVRYDTADDMRRAAHQPCDCVTLSKRLNIPLVPGQLFVRHPRLLRKNFHIDSRVLLQHGNNDAFPTWKVVRQSMARSARNVPLKLLPERMADVQASALYSSLWACAKGC